jgi:nitrate/TMAO reductase-like tetraheme cytochrome c subunit
VESRLTLARHPLSIAGAALATISAVLFIALVIALLIGLLNDPYAGLVIFVALPLLFVIGLLAIPLGMMLERRRLRRTGAVQREWPVLDFALPRTRRVGALFLVLTSVNLVIILVAGYGALHWMESPSFCGQTCHTPMHPQFTSWQDAPHSRIACVQCHIGEGGTAFVHYKLNGVRQLYHVVTGKYPRPIPGVADMRPALETCGNCHWARRDLGEMTRVKREYADDESNSETVTTLQMLVGGPGRPTSSGHAIHWHADPSVRIEYVATDTDRQTIPYVRSVDAQGKVKEYKAEGAADEQIAKGARRVMDCIDCHNLPAHRIDPAPEKAVDAVIASGAISRTLPFVRREGVRLVKADYPTSEAGLQAIERGLREFYAGKAAVDQRDLARAVASLQNVYRRNVFPSMKVTFGVYPDNIGHMTSSGCLRCHDGSHTAPDGTTIGADCEYCHKQIDQPAGN